MLQMRGEGEPGASLRAAGVGAGLDGREYPVFSLSGAKTRGPGAMDQTVQDGLKESLIKAVPRLVKTMT